MSPTRYRKYLNFHEIKTARLELYTACEAIQKHPRHFDEWCYKEQLFKRFHVACHYLRKDLWQTSQCQKEKPLEQVKKFWARQNHSFHKGTFIHSKPELAMTRTRASLTDVTSEGMTERKWKERRPTRRVSKLDVVLCTVNVKRGDVDQLFKHTPFII